MSCTTEIGHCEDRPLLSLPFYKKSRRHSGYTQGVVSHLPGGEFAVGGPLLLSDVRSEPGQEPGLGLGRREVGTVWGQVLVSAQTFRPWARPPLLSVILLLRPMAEAWPRKQGRKAGDARTSMITKSPACSDRQPSASCKKLRFRGFSMTLSKLLIKNIYLFSQI